MEDKRKNKLSIMPQRKYKQLLLKLKKKHLKLQRKNKMLLKNKFLKKSNKKLSKKKIKKSRLNKKPRRNQQLNNLNKMMAGLLLVETIETKRKDDSEKNIYKMTYLNHYLTSSFFKFIISKNIIN